MKRFNTTGLCNPEEDYMVDISEKLEKIKLLVENEKYFVINRPRQYGKTTTLFCLSMNPYCICNKVSARPNFPFPILKE